MSDNKKGDRSKNIDAQNIIKVSNIQMQDGSTASTGAEAFATLFNSLVDNIQEKAQKEADRPRYRFLETARTDYQSLIKNDLLVNTIVMLQDQLNSMGFDVKIYEDLDCKDVTNTSRYYIRIYNVNNIYVDINLLDYETKIKDFTFNEQDYIEVEISKIIGYTNSETKKIANFIVDYIAHIMYFRDLYTLTYKKIGWEYYNWDRSFWIFKYDKIYKGKNLFINGRLSNSLAEGLERVEDDGYLKEFEWVSHTNQLLNNHSYDAMILGAGISGLIRQLLPYTKETNININIVGKPASGKSTIGHYLLGIFGNPEKIEGSFTDTTNSMEKIRVKRPILPYVLDERMLKIQNESEKSKQQIVLMDIFREYEGKVKERLGKQYEEEAGERTYGPIISSSVKRMMDIVFKSEDLGQYRRFMEFDIGDKNARILFNDSAEAKKTETIAYKNYGIGVRIIIDYMLSILNEKIETENGNLYIPDEPVVIRKRFNELDEVINQRLEEREEKEKAECIKKGKNSKINGLTSSSKRFALIILSYQIFRESLLWYHYQNVISGISEVYVDEEIFGGIKTLFGNKEFKNIVEDNRLIEDKTEEIIEILINNLVDKMNRIIRKPEEYTNAIYDYVIAHRDEFYEGTKFKKENLEDLHKCKGEKLGFCIINENQRELTLYTLQRYALAQFLYMEEIPQPEEIRKIIMEMEEQGIRTPSNALKHCSSKEYNTLSMKATDEKHGKANNKEINTEVKNKSEEQKKEDTIGFFELSIQYTDLEEGES